MLGLTDVQIKGNFQQAFSPYIKAHMYNAQNLTERTAIANEMASTFKMCQYKYCLRQRLFWLFSLIYWMQNN